MCVCVWCLGIHVYTHTHVYTYTNTYIYIYIHTHTHNTQIHTQARIQELEQRLSQQQQEKDSLQRQLTELRSVYAAALHIDEDKRTKGSAKNRDRPMKDSSLMPANSRDMDAVDEDTGGVCIGRARWLMAQNSMLLLQVGMCASVLWTL